MAELFKVNAPVRKPLFEGVQGENEARSIQFDITPWVEELGDGAVTATAKRSQDSQPYPVTVTKNGTTVTWKPTSTDTAFAGVGSFQLEYTVDDVLAKTCIWSTMVAPSLDPAGDPPDPYDNWLAEMREIEASAIQAAQDADESADDAQAEVYEAEAWAKGTKNGTPVPSTADQYQNNAKYWAEQSLANQYGAFIVKSASGDIASFADGADDVPMKSVNVTITPKQSGSGDPSPSNVRPITGWTDADVHVANENFFDSVSWVQLGVNSNYYSVASDGKITVTANDTSSIGTRLFSLKPGAHLKLIINGFRTATVFDSNSSGLVYDNFIVPADGKIAIKFFANTYPTTGWAMIVPYESTVTEYVPYTGHTTPVPLGQTVYGGTVNPISGELVIDRIMVSGWTQFNQNNGYKAYRADNLPSGQGYNLQNEPMCNMVNEYGSFSSGSMDRNIIQVPSSTTTQAYMALDENIDPTTVQFTYKIGTPQTVQLTPTQVATLLGTNNVWADCGSVAVEYRADPTLAYAELEALILENI